MYIVYLPYICHSLQAKPSSSSYLYIWNQGVDRYLIYWLAWELGSKYIGNWKIRENVGKYTSPMGAFGLSQAPTSTIRFRRFFGVQDISDECYLNALGPWKREGTKNWKELFFFVCPRGGCNWGTRVRIPREDWGTLRLGESPPPLITCAAIPQRH